MKLTAAQLRDWEKELSDDAIASDIAVMLDLLKRMSVLLFEAVHPPLGGNYRGRVFAVLADFEAEVIRCTGKEAEAYPRERGDE